MAKGNQFDDFDSDDLGIIETDLSETGIATGTRSTGDIPSATGATATRAKQQSKTTTGDSPKTTQRAKKGNQPG